MKISQVAVKVAVALSFVLLPIRSMHAQVEAPFEPQQHFCRPGSVTAIDGSWEAQLSITNIGTTKTLMSLSQGGGLIETDLLDLVDPNVVHSPGYGDVRATGCNEFAVTIVKYLYILSAKQPLTTTLHGSVVLSEDGNSWSGQLTQQFKNAEGTVVSTDVVTATAKRITASSK